MIIAVADCGSMVGAAVEVGLTQPAVTKAIREMERDLKVPLFDRGNRGVTPTIYGDVLVRRARMVIAQLAQAAGEIEDLAHGTGGRVMVGTLLAGAAWLLPRAVAQLHEKRPNVKISIVEGTNERLMPMLQYGELDLVVGRLRELALPDGIGQEALYDERVIVVARKGHPLDDGEYKTTEDFQHFAWILPSSDTTLRRQIDQAFLSDGLGLPNVVIESVSLQTNRRLLRETDLVCVMSESVAAEDIAAGNLVRIPTRRKRGAGPVGVSMRQGKDLSPVASEFLAALREVASNPPKSLI
jgi:DNA-binding transcriptional LysR family regulator